MTATLFGADLQIVLGAADDVAYLSNDGTNYIVRGTGLSGYAAANAAVNSVSVGGTAAANQSFTVAAGVGSVLTDPLTVAASIERTTIAGAVNTTGDLLIDSAAITLASDITTTGQQRFKGAVGLVGTRTLSAGAGNVTFESTVDSSPSLFADPDAFAAGTALNTAFSGVTLSNVGDFGGGDVTSEGSDVATVTTGDYAPTGNRVFGSPSAWNAPNDILKATFAAPVTSVSLDFAPDDDFDPNAYIEAYDADGNKVASATYPPAIPELSFVTLTVSAPNIAYVLASFGPGDINNGLLDNLRATLATTPAATLTVNSSSTTTFGGVVGGTAALASLTTDALGETVVASSAITTVNDQVYNDAYILRADTTLTSNNNGRVAFLSTVDSYDANYRSLTVNTGGSTEFGDGGADYVGNTYRLLSLTTDAGGTTQVWIAPSNDTTPSIRTQNGQTYNDAATLKANAVFTSTNSAITFGSTLDGNQALTLTAGTGNVTFTGLVGNTTPLGAVTINSAANVTANGIRAASLSQLAGSGTTTLNGGAFTSAPAGTEAVRTTDAAGVSLKGTNLAVNGSITTLNAGVVTFDESGTITIAVAGDIIADGAVSLKAVGGITTAGDVTTTNDPVTFQTATTLSGPVAVSTGAGVGDITFGSTLDGNQTLSLAAGTGSIRFKGAVGSVAPLGGISLLSAASTTADSTIKLDGSSKLAADGLAISENVNNVSFANAGSEIKNFTGNGVAFKGGSTNSLLSGFSVSSNRSNGMSFAVGSYAGTTIASNTISNNGDAVSHTGNGILVQGSNLMIGWDANPASATGQNVISNNALNGIEISGSGAVRNTILSNSIFLNGQGLTQVVDGNTVLVGEGIALTAGGNGAQVAPTIYDVVRDSKNGKVHVQLMVPAAGSYLVQLFASNATDEQGIFPVDVNGFQGRTFVGVSPSGSPAPVGTGKPIVSGTPVAGNTLVAIEVDASLVGTGDWITATATLLDGTTPTSTSGFSAGVQALAGQNFAVGADALTTWTPDLPYVRVNQNEIRVFTPNVRTAVALHSYRNAEIVLAPSGGAAGTTVVRTVTSVTCVGRNVVRLRLKPGESLSAGGGSMFLAPVSLPAARLYDAGNGTVMLDVTPARMVAALTDPTMVGIGGRGMATNDQARAFVSRFQGGIRVASADVNGDGFVDIVTAPGGGAGMPGGVFGDTPRIITIYNGNPNGTWQSSSINVSGEAGLAAYAAGFQVSLANVRPENTGSGNAVAELVVASANKVFVYEMAATSRGAKPIIDPFAKSVITTVGSVTGLTAGTFTDPVLADIIVATTTASRTQVTQWLGSTNLSQSLNRPASVTVYSAAANFTPTSTFTLGHNLFNGNRQQNVFIGGASLAVGDVDNAPDGKPELILGAQSMGLANIRVLPSDVVAVGNQATVDAVLAGWLNVPSRAPTTTVNGKQVWQPTGGPDYFTGMASVPNAVALGANAPVTMAVVDSNGNGRAEIFAALGATNSTGNVVRRLEWNGVNAWDGASTLAGAGSIAVLPAPGFAKSRFPLGRGLRLG